ncbi:MAG: hypothetical protein K2K32_09165 [Muribaculaceae bacterium]|nr:hypothetical protein [Muribaculaceae bacterium]
MKMKLSTRLVLSSLVIMISALPALSQSIKYNGDIETGVVVHTKFATNQINAATSHGIYFTSPQLFIGAGAAIGWNINAEFYRKVYPIYGDIRKDFSINNRFTFFIDAKAGYSFQGDSIDVLGDCGLTYGFYCYPSLGLRIATSKKCGLYLKCGYTYQNATKSWEWYADGIKFAGSERYNAGGFSASIGFSFQ